MSEVASHAAAPTAGPATVGHFRWTICGLLFAVTTVNYLDRQVFGILAPELIKLFGWSRVDYTNMVFWFEAAYALGFVGAGWFLDRVGTRLGLALAAAFWSIAAMAHAAVSTVLGFKIMRFLLGLAEPSHLPGAIKAIAEWFPQKERALATGLYKAGGNIGAVVAPLLVPWLFVMHGWRWAFIITGGLGLIWLVFWLWLYRLPADHPKLGDAERTYIQSEPPEPSTPVRWRVLLRHPQAWGYVVAKFLTDAVWHWYLYLLPLYFFQHFRLDLKHLGPPLAVIYAFGDTGSIGGGWLSSWLMRRGWAVTGARKFAMLVCVLCVLPVAIAGSTAHEWVAVGVVALATAAHQGFTSNLFTTVSDIFPKRTVASLVGLGGFVGMLGALLIVQITTWLIEAHRSYTLIFFAAGLLYILALAIFHWMAPTLDQVKFEEGRSATA